MLTSEERIAALHERIHKFEHTQQLHRYIAACAAMGSACLVITVLAAIAISKKLIRPFELNSNLMGSMFTETTTLGYIVVALIAFCLGTLVTIFCFRLKKSMDEKEKHNNLM